MARALGLLLVSVVPQCAALKIDPKLDPKSDKEFFGKDYPSDVMPQPPKSFKFKYPFPGVQATDMYDKDYVKDENQDGGEWKAQMDYDVIRNKIRKQQEETDSAEKRKEAAESDYAEAQKKAEEAEAMAKKAEATAKEADKEANNAETKVEDLMGEGKDGKGGLLGDATKDVEKEVKDLEDCKKQLAEAKAKLQKLMNNKEAVEKEHTEKKAKKDAAAKEATSTKATEAELDKKAEKEKAEHEEAKKKLEEQEAEVKRTEAELEAAEKRLKETRAKPKNTAEREAAERRKSGAVGAQSTTAALVALLAATFAL